MASRGYAELPGSDAPIAVGPSTNGAAAPPSTDPVAWPYPSGWDFSQYEPVREGRVYYKARTIDLARTGIGQARLRVAITVRATGEVRVQQRTVVGQANLQVRTVTSSSGASYRSFSAALNVRCRVTASGGRLVTADSRTALTATARLSGTAELVQVAAVSPLRAQFALSGSALRRPVGRPAPLRAKATLTAKGVEIAYGKASLRVPITLTVAGAHQNTAEARLGARFTLTASGARRPTGRAALQAKSSLAAAGGRAGVGAATLAARARVVSMSGGQFGEAHLTMAATAAVTAVQTHTARAAALPVRFRFTTARARTSNEAAADLKVKVRLNAWLTHGATAALQATFTLRATGQVRPVADNVKHQLQVGTDLAATGTSIGVGRAALIARASVRATGTAVTYARCDLAAAVTMTANTGAAYHAGRADLAVLTEMRCAGVRIARPPRGVRLHSEATKAYALRL